MDTLVARDLDPLVAKVDLEAAFPPPRTEAVRTEERRLPEVFILAVFFLWVLATLTDFLDLLLLALTLDLPFLREEVAL